MRRIERAHLRAGRAALEQTAATRAAARHVRDTGARSRGHWRRLIVAIAVAIAGGITAFADRLVEGFDRSPPSEHARATASPAEDPKTGSPAGPARGFTVSGHGTITVTGNSGSVEIAGSSIKH